MLNVIFVDDDINVRNSIKRIIDWEGIGANLCAVEKNGKNALESIYVINPDLVISDIKMPVMDGLELCRCIREYSKNIDIILLSAYDDFAYAQKALVFGVKEYILKPIDMDKIKQLTETVHALAQQHEKKQSFKLLLHSDELKRTILDALKNGDRNSIEFIFDSEVEQCYDDITVKEFCLLMVKILYDYMDYIGIDSNICLKSKNNILQKLLALKSIDGYKVFVMECYASVLQFTNNSDENKEKIAAMVKAYINSNFRDSNLNVNSISQHFKLASAYLSSIFKQVENVNIVNCISDVRMKYAMEMLEYSSMQVQDIATNAGFIDAHYFARVFKKYTGTTPSEYRVKLGRD